jgi:hypothetical protein
MASANEGKPESAISWPLAGLQAGVLGVLIMLGWLGISSFSQRRNFWAAANLMGSFFYGEAALRPGFSRATLSGVALYLLVYGTLGIVFGMIFRDRLRGLRLLLCALIFAAVWYYVSFGLIWKRLAPLVSLLYAERPMVIGHLMYGLALTKLPKPLPSEPSEPNPAG